MEIKQGGIDIFYLDESGAHGLHLLTAIRVPFIRFENGTTTFVWKEMLDRAVSWRRCVSKTCEIKFKHELHGVNLLNSRDCYHKSGRNLLPDEAYQAYRFALETLTFLPESSIFTVAATDESALFDWRGLQACFMALMQRIRTHCASPRENTNGMLFFDDGHDEYVTWFRRACVHLPTGTLSGTQNLPLSMFLKDGNFKKSHLSYFVQIADLVCYAALQKLSHERGVLNARRERRLHHLLHEATPSATRNLMVSRSRGDGIALI